MKRCPFCGEEILAIAKKCKHCGSNLEKLDHVSFIRWQGITRNHFSSVANLILALATGLLAFQSNLLLKHKLVSCGAYGFAVASLIILAVSVASGLWCSVNRLRDFRLTTQIARRREKMEAEKDHLMLNTILDTPEGKKELERVTKMLNETELQDSREESRSLGKFTWRLFWTQVTFFGLGAGCGAIAVIIQVCLE